MNTATKIGVKLIQDIKKAEEKQRLFLLFPYTFATTCWASDSGKPVWNCWCAQCKETIDIVRTTGELPHWAVAE